MRRQLRQTLENMKAALEAAGATLSDLVRTNTYVTDIEEYFKHTDVRMEYYSHAMPTSTTVEIRRLSQPELMVEIDAIAAVGGPGSGGAPKTCQCSASRTSANDFFCASGASMPSPQYR